MTNSLVFLAILGLSTTGFAIAGAPEFQVDSVLDQQDATPGDGICATASGTCTLRAAITEANALAGANLIKLPAGVYTSTLVTANDNGNLGGDFDINSDITINGAGSGTTIVQAAASAGTATERVFHLRFAGSVVLNDLTVRHGRYTTLANTYGAGIRVEGAAVLATLNNVLITANEGGTSGGGLAIASASNSVTTLNNCRVDNNAAGGTAASSATGAGIMLDAVSGTLNINNSTISGNVASNTSTTVGASGGGISSRGILNITNSLVTNNTATSSGSTTFSGGIHVTGETTTIIGSTISNNASTVTAGTGSGFAGGIYNQQAIVNITNSVVSGNSASQFHGGIRTLGSTTAATTNITNSTVSNNSAIGEGGGVVNFAVGAGAATTNIIGSTLSGNSTNGLGGGLDNFSNSPGLATVNVTNSTLSANTAANGAGSYNLGAAASIHFNYSTIVGNTASSSGGGLFQDATGSVNLKNSIVADNVATSGSDIVGTVTSQGYNHVESVAGGTFTAVGGDISGTDPQLWSLANNGGTTLTHLPASTSPVIDTIPSGISDCGMVVSTSQNGLSRPQLGGCDKGSVETNPQFIFRNGFDGD